jgi:hypothetical protein
MANLNASASQAKPFTREKAALTEQPKPLQSA